MTDRRKLLAKQLLDNELLQELFDEMNYNLFEAWKAHPEPDNQAIIHSKANALEDLRTEIDTRCRDIAAGDG